MYWVVSPLFWPSQNRLVSGGLEPVLRHKIKTSFLVRAFGNSGLKNLIIVNLLSAESCLQCNVINNYSEFFINVFYIGRRRHGYFGVQRSFPTLFCWNIRSVFFNYYKKKTFLIMRSFINFLIMFKTCSKSLLSNWFSLKLLVFMLSIFYLF